MQSVFLGILILYCMLNIYRTLAFKWVWVGRLINYIHSMFNHEMSHWLLIYVIFKNKNCPIMSNLVSNQTSRLLQCCLKIDARMINGFCKLLIFQKNTQNKSNQICAKSNQKCVKLNQKCASLRKYQLMGVF